MGRFSLATSVRSSGTAWLSIASPIRSRDTAGFSMDSSIRSQDTAWLSVASPIRSPDSISEWVWQLKMSTRDCDLFPVPAYS